jgi:WD40 repeat protein
MADELSFQELMQRVRRGDEAAAAELLRHYEPSLRRVVHVRLVSAGVDGRVLLWNLDQLEAEPRELLKGRPVVYCVAFHPKGQRLAIACGDRRVRVIDVATGKLLQNLLLHISDPVHPEVFSVAYSPDGRYLASAGRDGWVHLLEAESGRELRRFQHGGDARRVAFSPDGRWLASGAFDGTIKMLDLTQMAADPVHHNLRGGIFLDLAFSPDSFHLACSTRMGGVIVVSPETGKYQFEVREDLGVLCLAFGPDSERLATAGETLRVKVWDVTGTGEPRHFDGHDGAIYSLAIHPHQQPQPQVAVAGAYNTGFGYEGTTVRLFDLMQQRFVREFSGHTKGLTSVAFRPDGRQLATASVDRTARLWGVATGKQQGLALKHGGPVTAVAYNPDGATLATSCADGQLRLWNVAQGQLLRTFAGHDQGINAVAFDPTGRYLASGGMDKTLRVWDVATGRALHEYHHARVVSSVVFSWDGRHLASADVGQTLRLWHVADDGALTPAHNPVQLRHSVTAESDQLAVLRGSRQRVTSLAFSPDDHRLASVSPDHPVQIWDVTSGHEVLTLADTPEMPLCVAFSPDGRYLVLGAAEGRVEVWDTDVLDSKTRAEAAAARAPAWHLEQAQNAINDKAQFATIFHANRKIVAELRALEGYTQRARAHAELGHWEEARADYTRALWLRPELSWFWHRVAITYLGAGDRAGHHDACARMLRQCAGDPEAAMSCLYACAPDPEAGGNPAQLLDLARAFVKAQGSNGFSLRTYGAALYRAGRYQQTIQAFEAARKANFAPEAWDWLFLAMAHHDLGHDVEARKAFDEAERQIAAAGHMRTRGTKWGGWFMEVEAATLRREAETRLRGKR